MKFAIDCRMIDSSGIGVFTQGILQHLDESHEYILIGDPDRLRPYETSRCKILPCHAKPHSLAELYFKIGECDALYLPNYSLFGISIRNRFITIHDVIFLDHPEFSNSFFDKIIKKIFINISIMFSIAIFTVSDFSKSRIKANISTQKEIHVVPNAVLGQPILQSHIQIVKSNMQIVFVGNLKKHKNIITLINAVDIISGLAKDVILYIIGSEAGLRTKDHELLKLLNKNTIKNNIRFYPKLSRAELMQIISTSRYLVQPSIYEGFSIPPLEALACGTQPIISDIPVHHEIFDGAPVRYFNPKDAVALAKEIINNPDPILPIAYSTFVSNKGYCYSNTAKLILNKIISHIEKC